MRSITGIALLTVLLFMQIWVLMGMLVLTTAWLAHRTNHYFWETHQVLAESVQMLTHFQLPSSADCQVEPMSTQALREKSVVWWAVNGCKKKFQHNYFYVIEPLGVDECGYIQLHPSPLFGEYFRVTMRIDKEVNPPIMQATLVFPSFLDPVQAKCKCLHQIKPGVQMVRRID